MRAFKVGGIRFLRIGRLQFSFCVCRKRRVKRDVKRKLERIRQREVDEIIGAANVRVCCVTLRGNIEP